MQKYDIKYLSQERNIILSNLICDDFKLLKISSGQYPDQDRWYYVENVPRILKGSGEQISVIDGDKVIAMMALKYGKEKKICSIRVDEVYQKQGIGSMLLDYAFNILGTNKPLITISESKLKDFDSIIQSNDWRLDEIIKPNDKYAENEYVFNSKRLVRKK